MLLFVLSSLVRSFSVSFFLLFAFFSFFLYLSLSLSYCSSHSCFCVFNMWYFFSVSLFSCFGHLTSRNLSFCSFSRGGGFFGFFGGGDLEVLWWGGARRATSHRLTLSFCFFWVFDFFCFGRAEKTCPCYLRDFWLLLQSTPFSKSFFSSCFDIFIFLVSFFTLFFFSPLEETFLIFSLLRVPCFLHFLFAHLNKFSSNIPILMKHELFSLFAFFVCLLLFFYWIILGQS